MCFGENGIIKNAFLKNKKQININDVDIKRIVSSDEKSYGNKDSFKYFIGYKHKGNGFSAPLVINIYMNAHSKYLDKNNKYMNLLVNDKEILKKYTEIWEKN